MQSFWLKETLFSSARPQRREFTRLSRIGWNFFFFPPGDCRISFFFFKSVYLPVLQTIFRLFLYRHFLPTSQLLLLIDELIGPKGQTGSIGERETDRLDRFDGKKVHQVAGISVKTTDLWSSKLKAKCRLIRGGSLPLEWTPPSREEFWTGTRQDHGQQVEMRQKCRRP